MPIDARDHFVDAQLMPNHHDHHTTRLGVFARTHTWLASFEVTALRLPGLEVSTLTVVPQGQYQRPVNRPVRFDLLNPYCGDPDLDYRGCPLGRETQLPPTSLLIPASLQTHPQVQAIHHDQSV